MNIEVDLSNVTLKTERLTIRPWSFDDVDDFYKYAKVDGVGQMAGWLPHKSKDESRDIIDIFIREKKVLAIEYKGKAIGSIAVEKYEENLFPEYASKAGREIGFALSKDYWGKGIMPEAVKSVIDFLFRYIGLDFVICGYYVENKQSERVQEKLGFKLIKTRKRVTQCGEEHICAYQILEK